MCFLLVNANMILYKKTHHMVNFNLGLVHVFDKQKETYLLEGLQASDKSQTCHMVQDGPHASCQELRWFGTI